MESAFKESLDSGINPKTGFMLSMTSFNYDMNDYNSENYENSGEIYDPMNQKTEERGIFLENALNSDKMTTEVLDKLRGYGCWCYFDGKFGRGKSKPVNLFDELCRGLQHGYECAMMDARAENEVCVPWEINYNGTRVLELDNIAENCAANNLHSKCAERACTIEKFFVLQVISMMWNGDMTFDPTKAHNEGFDVFTECPTKEHVESERACCGDYPKIFPYKTFDGARQCCPKICKTYDPNRLQCCEVGDSQVLAKSDKECPMFIGDELIHGDGANSMGKRRKKRSSAGKATGKGGKNVKKVARK